MASRKQTAGFVPSPHFVFRSPLLPLAELASWVEDSPGRANASASASTNPAPGSGDGQGSGAGGKSDEALATELARQSEALRARLRRVIERPEVRDALFLASPDLDESLTVWREQPDSPRGQKIERSLVRYFARMTGRATPFGLFSAISVGRIAERTDLALAGRSAYQRHTRLDNDYLFALTDAANRDAGARRSLTYWPNDSLFRAAGRWRYAEAKLHGKNRTYHLVTVEPTEYLDATLERARAGATAGELAEALVVDDPDIALDEAQAFIEQLIDGQILLSELTPGVTGAEPIHGVVATLHGCPAMSEAATALAGAARAIEAIDAAGPGAEPAAYRAIASSLASLPVPIEISRMFQVDMVKPAPQATLGQAVIDDITRGIEVLHRISPRDGNESLTRFRNDFTARYEEREVPLLEALDEEAGIGFEVSNAPTAEAAPLLAGLRFPGGERPVDETLSAAQSYLLDRLQRCLAAGQRVLALDSRDLARMAPRADSDKDKDREPLVDAFSVMAILAAPSAEALAAEKFVIFMEGGGGPSGANLSGRFCHASAELHQAVLEHLRAEEALRPDAVFAEIVHLNQGRIGNILCRPVLREHEIPFLGLSGAPRDKQLPLSDLMVSVSGQRIILRSRSLDREVLPRLTTAHNFQRDSIGPYRFLCHLQSQGRDTFRWSWGPLARLPFLPRVSHGRLVFARATWRLGKDDLAPLVRAVRVAKKPSEVASCRADAVSAIGALRDRLGWPRWVVLADFDNELPIDLDNVLCCDTFAHMVRKRDQIVVHELFPQPDELVAHGPEGRFVSQLVLSFVRRDAPAADETSAAAANAPPAAAFRTSAAAGQAPVTRSFGLGSEWLYVKLYTGTASADDILRQAIAPVSRQAITSGAAQSWFFIRFQDAPGHHVRVRWRGEPDRLRGEILPALEHVLAPLRDDGLLWRMQLDTYEREIERYGGPAGIELAETFFHADSDAVLDIVDGLSGDEGAEARWRMALLGSDRLLDDLGLDLQAKYVIMKSARDGMAEEFHADTTFHKQLGERFRAERGQLAAWLGRSQQRARELAGNPAQAGEPGEPGRAGASGESGESGEPGSTALEENLAAGLDILDRRSRRMAPVRAELVRRQAQGLLTRPISGFASSYVHMYVNRLLRSAQRAHELVIYDFLRRMYESELAQGKKKSARSA